METRENIEPVETEEIKVDDHDVKVEQLPDGSIQVFIPDSIQGEAREDLIKAITPKSKVISSYYRKHQLLNQDKEAFEKYAADFKEGKITDEPKAPDQPAQAGDDPIWKTLGLKSEDELTDFIVDHPKEFADAQREQIRKEVLAATKADHEKLKAELEQGQTIKALETTITSAGYQPQDVKAFAKFHEMPFGEKAFELYRLKYADKSDPVVQARLASQAKQVTYIDTSQRSIRPSTINDANDIKNLADDDLTIVTQQLIDRASGS